MSCTGTIEKALEAAFSINIDIVHQCSSGRRYLA